MTAFKKGKTDYQFITRQGKLVKITRKFSSERDTIRQEFYLQNNSLLFSTESITSYFGRDCIGWASIYYFENGKIKDYETLGHGKSEDENWVPGKEVLQNFQKARSEVNAYIKKAAAEGRQSF